MVYFARATLRFDGSAQPNPGRGGAGYVLTNDSNGNVIIEGRYYVGGDCTNNVAEYFGLIGGLRALRSSAHRIGSLDIEGDSELVIKQMKDVYSVSSRRLRPLHAKAGELLRSGGDIDSHSFIHISRDRNAKADMLAREAIEMQSDWKLDHYLGK